MKLSYFYAKFFKKIVRGRSIRNSIVDKTASIYSGTELYDSEIGRHSYIGYDSEVHHCKIGSFCSIANGFIAGGAEHPLEWVSTSPAFQNVGGGAKQRLARLSFENGTKQTIIENDVWIGARVIVKQGVHIGNGAVIGAGSVVTKDVPDYAIVAGNPAKVIRYRFEQSIIGGLLETEWWNKPDTELLSYSEYMNNPHLLIKKLLGGGILSCELELGCAFVGERREVA